MKKKKVFLLMGLAIIGVLIAGVSVDLALGDSATQKVIKDIEDKTAAISSYKVKSNIFILVKGEEESFSETRLFKAPHFYKSIFMPWNHITICDGKYIWWYRVVDKDVHKREFEKLDSRAKEEKVGGFRSFLRFFSFTYKNILQYKGKEYYNGDEVYVFEGPSDLATYGGNAELTRGRFLIRVKDGALILSKYFYKDQGQEKVAIIETYTDILLNPEIPDNEFMFVLPKGVKIIDEI